MLCVLETIIKLSPFSDIYQYKLRFYSKKSELSSGFSGDTILPFLSDEDRYEKAIIGAGSRLSI